MTTKQYFRMHKCPNCGQESDPSAPLSKYLRGLDAPYDSKTYDNQDIDHLWFRYMDGWFIILEGKAKGAHSDKSQRDTHGILTQLLQIASNNVVRTLRGNRAIEFRGYYEVSFENTDPKDSKWVEINGFRIEENVEQKFLELLQNGVLPEIPRIMQLPNQRSVRDFLNAFKAFSKNIQWEVTNQILLIIQERDKGA